MREFNWAFAAALLGPLTVMIVIYCFGLLQEQRRERASDFKSGQP